MNNMNRRVNYDLEGFAKMASLDRLQQVYDVMKAEIERRMKLEHMAIPVCPTWAQGQYVQEETVI